MVLLVLTNMDEKPSSCFRCKLLLKSRDTVDCPLIENSNKLDSFEAQYMCCPIMDIVDYTKLVMEENKDGSKE